MGQIRTLGSVLAVKGQPTPVYTGTPIAAVSAKIVNGVATIVLGAGNLPANGFNGPRYDLGTTGGGQQVTLWGFGVFTYFNGLKVTVISNDPSTGSFSFNTTHGDVVSTADAAGLVAASPFQHYRAVRLECGQGLGTDLIYVGDLHVSSTRYMACLSLAGQLAIEIASENIPADGIFVDTSGVGAGDTVQVSLIY